MKLNVQYDTNLLRLGRLWNMNESVGEWAGACNETLTCSIDLKGSRLFWNRWNFWRGSRTTNSTFSLSSLAPVQTLFHCYYIHRRPWRMAKFLSKVDCRLARTRNQKLGGKIERQPFLLKTTLLFQLALIYKFIDSSLYTASYLDLSFMWRYWLLTCFQLDTAAVINVEII